LIRHPARFPYVFAINESNQHLPRIIEQLSET